MNQRIKSVRQHLGKTQKEFGESLGVSRDVYANIENARVEPNRTFLQLLCSLYNVNEAWLLSGQGEMYIEIEESLVDKLEVQYKLGTYGRKIIESYLGMNEEQRTAVDKFMLAILEAQNAGSDEPVDDAIEKTSRIFRAAKSNNNAAAEILEVSADRTRKLEEAPETDEI